MTAKKQTDYRGHTITRTGSTRYDYLVTFPGRTRWGTVAELMADIDAYLAGTLPPPARGWA